MIIKKPTKINAGAVAKLGIAIKIGLNTIETKNSNAVTADARPVLAPSETPEELSTKVVVVDVPKIAPTEVAIESANKAGLILGSFPSLSSIFALSAQPINVPKVSKISTNKNAHIIAKKSRTLKLANASAVKHFPNVCPIAAILKSLHTGRTESPVYKPVS